MCYGQQKTASEMIPKQIFAEKPRTLELKPDKRIISANASDNEKQLFVSEKEGLVYAFDLETMSQMWMTDLGGMTSSNLLETESLIYIVTSKTDKKNFEDVGGKGKGDQKNNGGVGEDVSEDKAGNSVGKTNITEKKDGELGNKNVSVLWAIDKKSGITSKRAVIFGDKDFRLFNVGAFVYVIDNFRLSVFDGNLDKRGEDYFFGKNLINQPFFDGEKKDLYLVFADEVVKVSVKENGLEYENIKFNMKNPIDVFAVSGDVYFAGDAGGNLAAYKKSDRSELWKFRAGGKISDIKVFADKIAISSFDNFIYCLRWSDGKRMWKKRFPGRISKISKSSDKDFFVQTSYSADYYLINADSGDITAQLLIAPSLQTSEINLQTTPRLIMLLKSYSIDIYKKN